MTRKKHLLFFMVILLSLFVPMLFAADDVSTYLILNDISPYKRLTQAFDAYSHKPKTIPGYTVYPGPGVLAGADHFIVDHSDMTYEADYQSDELGLGTEVQVTKHEGADSDRWLYHEVDKSFRTSLGIPGDSYGPRQIDGQTILEFGAGGREYRWLSGNKVIRIEYTDLQMEKPEPIEVVQAYLAKHPSTLAAFTQ